MYGCSCVRGVAESSRTTFPSLHDCEVVEFIGRHSQVNFQGRARRACTGSPWERAKTTLHFGPDSGKCHAARSPPPVGKGCMSAEKETTMAIEASDYYRILASLKCRE